MSSNSSAGALRRSIDQVRECIAKAAAAAGRNPEEIRLVAACKQMPASAVAEAIAAGITDIGENRVQEAEKKFSEMSLPPGAKFTRHMLGHLQTNKSKKAAEIFDWVQSLDRLDLAQDLQRHAAAMGKTLQCLIEIKVSSEETKWGCPPEKVAELVELVRPMANLRIAGIMAIPPYFDKPEDAVPYFRRARDLFEVLQNNKAGVSGNPEIRCLSMGMSHDFEIAIREGANMVRVGTAIFGPRQA